MSITMAANVIHVSFNSIHSMRGQASTEQQGTVFIGKSRLNHTVARAGNVGETGQPIRLQHG